MYNTGTTWEILAGMPVVNHYAVNLWRCAFLGGVVMFPRLANSNYEDIVALPPGERCKHPGAMVILRAVMTEYDKGQGAFSASAFMADNTPPSPASSVTDTSSASGVTDNSPASSVTDTSSATGVTDTSPLLQDF